MKNILSLKNAHDYDMVRYREIRKRNSFCAADTVKSRNPAQFEYRERNLICGIDMAKTRNPVDFEYREIYWGVIWRKPEIP